MFLVWMTGIVYGGNGEFRSAGSHEAPAMLYSRSGTPPSSRHMACDFEGTNKLTTAQHLASTGT